MKKIIAFVVLGAAVVFSGCNTVEGMGKDLEKAGEAVQKSSK